MFGLPPGFGIGGAIAYYVFQANGLQIATGDAIGLLAAASSLPAAAIGAVGLALWKKWGETDRDVKTYLHRQATLEERVEAMEPCRCSELRETLREWMSDQGDKLQATVTGLENRLDDHIDRG